MSEFFQFALDDEENKSPLTVAEKLLVAVIESKDPARIYDQALIDALGRAGSIKQHEAKRRLQDAFPKDMAVREWWARVNEATGKAWVTSEDGRYLHNPNGSLKANLANAATMMADIPVAYDSFACRTILTAAPPWRKTTGPWSDVDDTESAVWCQKQNLDVPSKITGETAIAMAQKTQIHPVRDYLQSHKWDGELRLDKWLIDYLGVPDTPYARSVAAKWMISAVNRVMEPGCQADYTLVLEGEKQGKRKSTALRVLGGEWFSDDLGDVGTKDAAMQLHGIWIYEIAELDAFKRAEMTTIKAFLTRRVDHFRPPFGQHDVDFPRQTVFAATTNKKTWGQDETGLRRFWPVATGKIDIPGLRKVRNQLWAEAFFRFGEGEKGYLVGEAEDVATVEQGERQDVDAWTDRVEKWAKTPERWTYADTDDFKCTPSRIYVADVMSHGLRLSSKDVNHVNKSRVVRILKLAGYQTGRVPRGEAEPDGKRPEFWYKS